MFRNRFERRKPTDNKRQRYVVPMTDNGHGVMKQYLTPELEEELKKIYPVEMNYVIMEWFGLSMATLHRFARKLGLKKDMKVIAKKVAKLGKMTCEKNGYYDSIRGKCPSEATLEGARRKRAEGFNPMEVFKAKNPRGYKKHLRHLSDARKSIIEKEKKRYKIGLSPLTNIPTYVYSDTAYTDYQTHARLLAKKFGYVLGDIDPEQGERTTIFYEEGTKRHPKFEASAAKRGGFDFQPIHKKRT